jgi:hypothetical protein
MRRDAKLTSERAENAGMGRAQANNREEEREIFGTSKMNRIERIKREIRGKINHKQRKKSLKKHKRVNYEEGMKCEGHG